MKGSLALFDFDGTITSRDSLFEIIRFIRGRFRFMTGMLLLSPFVGLHIVRVLPNWKVKERVLGYFFGGMHIGEFQEACDRFSREHLPRLVRSKANDEIRRLLMEGTRVVVVTASAENWIRGWTDAVGIELVATRLAVSDGVITGKLLGKNCHGDEKVVRIQEYLDLSDYTEVYTYGDTPSDLPMLRLGTRQHYKPFRD